MLSTLEQSKPLNTLYPKTGFKMLITLAWLISSLFFFVSQLVLGANFTIVALAFFSLLICGVPLLFFGVRDIAAVFTFALLSKYSFFPLWIKTFAGERIDVGLSSPLDTFLLAFAGSVITCIAFILVKFFPVKKRLLGFELTETQTVAIGYAATIFGLLFLMLHVIYSPVLLPTGELLDGFGGFGSLVGPLYFGVSCLVVISFRPKANMIHRVFLVIALLCVMFLSLQQNVRVHFTFAVATVVLTIIYFGFKIKRRYFVYGALFLLFYVYIFVPIVYLTRTTAFRSADLQDKVLILSNLFQSGAWLSPDTQPKGAFRSVYYSSYRSVLIIDRFEMIQDLDIVAAGITHSNTILWTPVRWAFEAMLPSFLYANKPDVSDIDLIAYNARYIRTLRTLNHTMGVYGSAYAMFLWPGLIWVSLVLIFFYLFILKILVKTDLSHNIFGVFFLVRYAFNFSEQSVQALITTIFRTIPSDIVLVLAILLVVTQLFSRARKVGKP